MYSVVCRGLLLGVCVGVVVLLFSSLPSVVGKKGYLESAGDGTVSSALIISVKDEQSLERIEKLCNGKAADWEIPEFADSVKKCRLSEKACRRIFRKSILGVAGEFTAQEVERLERCLPDGILYVESDALVMKAEGPRPSQRTEPHEALPSVEKEDIFPRLIVKRKLLQRTAPVRVPKGNDLVSIVSSLGRKIQDVHVALWNLDRIDQHLLPLDKTFHYGTSTTVGTGQGVNVYILDSGIVPVHREFSEWEGIGSRASYGYDFVDDDPIAEDCDGHGTHVASTVIGRSVGIAKQANVIAVRVLDCGGSGNISTTVAGLDWVAANYVQPAVVALSLGVSIGRWSQSLEDSVKHLINEHGVPVVVASGNSAVDSCFIAPANVPETITVAASDLDTKFGSSKITDKESVYRWSNTGRCVDIFAPGVDIYGACGGADRCDEVTDDSYTWASGTSMAVPHVAGVLALYLGDFPGMTPADLKTELIKKSTKDKIFSQYLREGSPNRLLYSQGMESIILAAEGR